MSKILFSDSDFQKFTANANNYIGKNQTRNYVYYDGKKWGVKHLNSLEHFLRKWCFLYRSTHRAALEKAFTKINPDKIVRTDKAFTKLNVVATINAFHSVNRPSHDNRHRNTDSSGPTGGNNTATSGNHGVGPGAPPHGGYHNTGSGGPTGGNHGVGPGAPPPIGHHNTDSGGPTGSNNNATSGTTSGSPGIGPGAPSYGTEDVKQLRRQYNIPYPFTMRIPNISQRYTNAEQDCSNWISQPLDKGTEGDTYVIARNDEQDAWRVPGIYFFGTYDTSNNLGNDTKERLEKHGLSDQSNYLSNFDSTGLYKWKMPTTEHAYQYLKIDYFSLYTYYPTSETPEETARDSVVSDFDKKLWRNMDVTEYYNTISQKASPDTVKAIANSQLERLKQVRSRKPFTDEPFICAMKVVLWAKFIPEDNWNGDPEELPEYTQDLLDTGDQVLIKGSKNIRWGMNIDDSNPDCVVFTGQNRLGKLEMELREYIRRKITLFQGDKISADGGVITWS